MRTTLTLDADVDERLREMAHRERKPFRTVVNEALRLGLGSEAMVRSGLRSSFLGRFARRFEAGSTKGA